MTKRLISMATVVAILLVASLAEAQQKKEPLDLPFAKYRGEVSQKQIVEGFRDCDPKILNSVKKKEDCDKFVDAFNEIHAEDLGNKKLTSREQLAEIFADSELLPLDPRVVYPFASIDPVTGVILLDGVKRHPRAGEKAYFSKNFGLIASADCINFLTERMSRPLAIEEKAEVTAPGPFDIKKETDEYVSRHMSGLLDEMAKRAASQSKPESANQGSWASQHKGLIIGLGIAAGAGTACALTHCLNRETITNTATASTTVNTGR